MASVNVFTCPAGQTQITVVGLSGRYTGTCSNGQGAWQSVTLAEPFDPATIDPAEAAMAFGAGFGLIVTGMLLSWPVRIIVRAVKEM